MKTTTENPMRIENLDKVLALAREHLGGAMVSSASFCLDDALNAQHCGDMRYAMARALSSLCYSIGILHPAYQKAWKLGMGDYPVLASVPWQFRV